MRPKILTEVFSAEELSELHGLGAELRRLRRRLNLFVSRMELTRRSSARALVGDRLRCVAQDSITPALQDLRSIARAARDLKKGRADRASTG